VTNDEKLKLIQCHVHNGIDIDNRSIYWGVGEEVSGDGTDGYVSYELVELLIRKLHLLRNISNEPIHFYMSSGGGCEYAMWRLYDELRLSATPIVFHGGGWLMSATTVIMQGCDEKLVTENSCLMVHEGYGGSPATEKPHDIYIESDELKKLCERIYRAYALHTKCPYEYWATICRYNAYITAQEALVLGLITGIETKDGIITDKSTKKELNKVMEDIKKRVYMHNIGEVK
jgi:ATP-dependent protease ClpP protease subunit